MNISKSAEQNIQIFSALDQFLKSIGINCADRPIIKYMEERERCGIFDVPRHLKGLIYSKLTSQQNRSVVAPKLPKVDELFFNYDVL